MRRAIAAPNSDCDPRRFAEVAAHVERAGWDGLFVYDHLHLAPSAGLAIHDPWVLLSAAAMVTERLVLGTAVTPISRRRPWQLAREVISLDHLTNGRVVLGIGLGGLDEWEFHPFGDTDSLRARASRTDEGLELFDRLVRGELVDHDGIHHQVHGVQLHPQPVQSPRPPIWIAATAPHRAGHTRAARWDGIFLNLRVDADHAALTPAEVADYVGELAARPGFDVVTFRHPSHAPSEYQAADVTWLVEPFGLTDWVDRALALSPS